jgi:alpha-L-fucosidase
VRFEQFLRNQMVELCRDYGRIEIMWLDGASVGCRADTRVDMDGILAECRKYQPWLIAADRCIKGKNEQLITPEQTVPEEPMACPWESCITMASNWSYRFDDEYKSAKELIQTFIGIVAKGGCLALNVAPRPDGVIPQPALERMNAMGAWLRANGSAIYATRPFPPYSVRNWCFTQRDGHFYAIRLTRNGERDIQQVVLNNDKSKGWKVARVVHVASGAEIPFYLTPDGWLLKLPYGFAADPYADVFELFFEAGAAAK